MLLTAMPSAAAAGMRYLFFEDATISIPMADDALVYPRLPILVVKRPALESNSM